MSYVEVMIWAFLGADSYLSELNVFGDNNDLATIFCVLWEAVLLPSYSNN